MNTYTRLISLALLALLAYAPATYAQGSSTTSFNVYANVPPTCQVSAYSLSFGNYTGAQTEGASSIYVNCARGTGYKVGLSNGFYANGSGVPQMRNSASANYLRYQLYSDSLRTSVWNTTTMVSDTGTGSSQLHTVYGRIFGSQSGPLGFYQDTITVTVLW